jgi:hypothetical protein
VRGAVAALSMISHAGMAEIVVEDYAEKSVVYIEKHIKD